MILEVSQVMSTQCLAGRTITGELNRRLGRLQLEGPGWEEGVREHCRHVSEDGTSDWQEFEVGYRVLLLNGMQDGLDCMGCKQGRLCGVP